MRIGEIDPKAEAINEAMAKLLSCLRRADEPSFDQGEMAQAIDQFVSAKIADALDRRY